jgi:hypothetical protein
VLVAKLVEKGAGGECQQDVRLRIVDCVVGQQFAEGGCLVQNDSWICLERRYIEGDFRFVKTRLQINNASRQQRLE